MRIKPEFIFSDERGKLVQLFDLSKWKEVNYITIKKGTIRGDHYHKKTNERFFIVNGEIKITLKKNISRSYICKEGDIIHISPMVKHTLLALTDVKLISFLSEKFNSKAIK